MRRPRRLRTRGRPPQRRPSDRGRRAAAPTPRARARSPPTRSGPADRTRRRTPPAATAGATAARAARAARVARAMRRARQAAQTAAGAMATTSHGLTESGSSADARVSVARERDRPLRQPRGGGRTHERARENQTGHGSLASGELTLECPAFYMERRRGHHASACAADGRRVRGGGGPRDPHDLAARGRARPARDASPTMDGLWSIWSVTWVARTIVADPVNLYDANIFYPHRRALAFSEANIVAGRRGRAGLVADAQPVRRAQHRPPVRVRVHAPRHVAAGAPPVRRFGGGRRRRDRRSRSVRTSSPTARTSSC